MSKYYKNPLFLIALGVALSLIGWYIIVKTEPEVLNSSVTSSGVSDESKFHCIVSVHFSPNGGCEREIIKTIGTAKKQIRVFAYSFTSEPIAHSLILMQMGGVDVQVIIDSGSAKQSEADTLASNDVRVYIDNEHAIMHSKVIIVDQELVLCGSYNYSKNAEYNNAENLVTIHSKPLAKKYLENWELHKSHSKLKAAW